MSEIFEWKKELLKEDSLHDVYKSSRSFNDKNSNENAIAVMLVLSLAVAIFVFFQLNNLQMIELQNKLSGNLFALTIAILGFLIAGFSIFATVTDNKLLVKLAKAEHDETGQSVFKYIFFSFLSVFIVYLISLSFSVTLLFLSYVQPTFFVPTDQVSSPNLENFAKVLNSLGIGMIIFAFMFCILRLKTFIWSIYQGFLLFVILSE